jgi:hypothetical protein
VHDERDVCGQAEGVEPGVEVVGVVGEAVAGRGAGPAHADKIWGQAAAQVGDVRDDVAPQVRRGRVAVQEDYRVALAGFDVVHLGVEHASQGHGLSFRSEGSVRCADDPGGSGQASLFLFAWARLERNGRPDRLGTSGGHI